jgi:hypothetical protein
MIDGLRYNQRLEMDFYCTTSFFCFHFTVVRNENVMFYSVVVVVVIIGINYLRREEGSI